MSQNDWFKVHKEGLRKVLAEKGSFWVIKELWQNAVDEVSRRVEITLEPLPQRGRAMLRVVDDNPEGFKDITHAYTLYAESMKKNDPTKRGRFNIGEKQVLALCDEAKIISVNHAVHFRPDGSRTSLRQRTEKGTIVEATIHMTREQIAKINEDVMTLISPPGVETFYNGTPIPTRTPLTTFKASLPTVVANEEGALTRSVRVTDVEVYEPKSAETPYIYEMGVPVVESQTAYHINVMQKVPLNQDRDNVTPAYYRQLVAAVVENMYDHLTETDVTQPWVDIALEDQNLTPSVVRSVITTRFGDKVTSYTPTDIEANRRAQAEGYYVIPSNTFSGAAWSNIRNASAVRPSGQLFATPKPFSDDPDAPPAVLIPESDWSFGMREVAQFTKSLFKECTNIECDVEFYEKFGTTAFYRAGKVPAIGFNVQALGRRFFPEWQERRRTLVQLLIHEFAHHLVTVRHNRPNIDTQHITEQFEDALEEIGQRLVMLALEHPERFKVSVPA